ncbi:MAG: hypothetical protein ABI548_15580 [Polyangiaceae bacterium]
MLRGELQTRTASAPKQRWPLAPVRVQQESEWALAFPHRTLRFAVCPRSNCGNRRFALAAAVSFARNESAFVNGAELPVNGGLAQV